MYTCINIFVYISVHSQRSSS